MYSLKITVEAIRFCSCYKELILLNQYSNDVEASLSYGQGYLIPALIWPPPSSNTRLLMKLILKVVS